MAVIFFVVMVIRIGQKRQNDEGQPEERFPCDIPMYLSPFRSAVRKDNKNKDVLPHRAIGNA